MFMPVVMVSYFGCNCGNVGASGYVSYFGWNCGNVCASGYGSYFGLWLW